MPDASHLTEEDGHRLAADLLAEMTEMGLDELSIDGAEYRAGRPQSDVLVRYLRLAQAAPAVERGFLAVLTDHIGASVDGGLTSDPEFYVKEASRG